MPDESGRMTIAEAAYWAAAAPGLLLRHAKFDARNESEEWRAAIMTSQGVFRLLEEIRSLTEELKSRASILAPESPTSEPARARPTPTRRPGSPAVPGAGGATGNVGEGGAP